MKPSEKDLVLVESAAELKPGIWVFIRGSVIGDALMLLVRGPRPCGHCYHQDSTSAWDVVGTSHPSVCCLEDGIPHGRVFRLRDLPAEDEQASEKHREAVS